MLTLLLWCYLTSSLALCVSYNSIVGRGGLLGCCFLSMWQHGFIGNDVFFHQEIYIQALVVSYCMALTATDGQCRDLLPHYVMLYGDTLFLLCHLHLFAVILVWRQSVTPSFNIWSPSVVPHKGKMRSINQYHLILSIYLLFFENNVLVYQHLPMEINEVLCYCCFVSGIL